MRGGRRAWNFDHVSTNRLPTYVKGPVRLTPGSLLRDAERLNHAALPGRAAFTQRDIFEFLDGIEADVLYLDPPYPGTQSYERAFALLTSTSALRPWHQAPSRPVGRHSTNC